MAGKYRRVGPQMFSLVALLASSCAHGHTPVRSNAPSPSEARAAEPKLSKDQIRATIRASRETFGACYISALEQGKRGQGTVVVFFRILADGRVDPASPSLVKTTLNMPDVEACVLRKVIPLMFPAPGEDATVRYPFTFELEEEGSVSK